MYADESAMTVSLKTKVIGVQAWNFGGRMATAEGGSVQSMRYGESSPRSQSREEM